MICQLSREYFTQIYKRLNITLEEFGESYYNPFIPPMVEELNNLGLIKEDSTVTKKGAKVDKKDQKKEEAKKEEEKPVEAEKVEQATNDQPERKAKCIFVEKFPNPLIVVKSDGGYNYDTTDLACIKHRLATLKADRVVYITDAGQR